MDAYDEKLPDKFVRELADVPPMPSHLYALARRRIVRKKIVMRTVWAVAASLVIMITGLEAVRLTRPHNEYVPEVAEELSAVNSYINSDVYKENDNSYAYYEETLYQE